MMDINLEYVTLSYKAPVPVRKDILKENQFLKVTLLEKDYYLSVLPNFHESTLSEVAFKIKHFFSQYQLDFKSIDLEKKFFNLTLIDSYLDSLNGEMLFHIESLLLAMIKTTHPEHFSHKEVLINTLYSEQFPLEHYENDQCIKIKIHPGKSEGVFRLIKDLHQLNPNILFRLDGNRRFELEEMIVFHDELQKQLPKSAFLRIDYIEEPFKNFYDTFLFEKRASLKIAIDESYKFYMHQPELQNISVIKPSLIGLSPIFFWLRFCQEKRAVISSSYEHPSIMVGLMELAKLRPNEFHGLENQF